MPGLVRLLVRLRGGDERRERLSTDRWDQVTASGGFTGPEFAQTGLTEANASRSHDVETAIVHFDSTTRTMIGNSASASS